MWFKIYDVTDLIFVKGRPKKTNMYNFRPSEWYSKIDRRMSYVHYIFQGLVYQLLYTHLRLVCIMIRASTDALRPSISPYLHNYHFPPGAWGPKHPVPIFTWFLLDGKCPFVRTKKLSGQIFCPPFQCPLFCLHYFLSIPPLIFFVHNYVQ